ncbi:MAG: helix-turn-helix transcriptional regulator [Deltaproteobacteria bacterium]|nr:helix-turn-helix transcriptional regulator [Deltaproteobacteria bacterium]
MVKIKNKKISESGLRAIEGSRQRHTINKTLETSLGNEVREFRRKLGLTVAQLANLAGLSTGMMSKLENGHASPSLATLQSLSKALNVPITSFLRQFVSQRDANFTGSGEGQIVQRRGSRAGYEYRLLGRNWGKTIAIEPYFITIAEGSDGFTYFQHDGIEFAYMLGGKMTYRHGNKIYTLNEGDSLFFDADVPHGPEEFLKLPISMITVIVYNRYSES